MKLSFPLLTAALAVWLALTPFPGLRAQDPAPEPQDNVSPSAPAAEPGPEAPAVVAPPPAPQPPAASAAPAAPEPVWVERGNVIVFGDDVVIRENERASKVTAFGGTVEVLGRVDGQVVAWGGDVKIEGFAGSVKAVGGDLALGPKAHVAGPVALIGGSVDNPHHVPLRSNPLELAPFLPSSRSILGWLGDLFLHARLLSPHVAWPWYVFGAGTLFFLLLAAAFGRGVNACARSLEERPGATLTTALALLPLLPFFALLLICTGIGILLLPFLAVLVLFGVAFGKAAVLVFLGRSVLRAFGAAEVAERAWLTLLIGVVLLAVLYCVPVLGLLVWALTAWIGLGMVTATIIENRRREKVERAAAVAPAMATPETAARPAPSAVGFVAPSLVPASAAVSASAAAESAPAASAASVEAGASAAAPEFAEPAAGVPPVLTPPAAPAAVPCAPMDATLPRADFGVRLGALVIDILLVVIVGGCGGLMLAWVPFPLLFGGYVFGFWLWKGTTIGGIVFNLKLARLDGRPIDGATSAVRTLVAFLSAFTVVGFLWCLWDSERQMWHDKVAGTVVVRVPKSAPLV